MAETVSTRLMPLIDVARIRHDLEALVMPSPEQLRQLCDSYELLVRESAAYGSDLCAIASIVERAQRRNGAAT